MAAVKTPDHDAIIVGAGFSGIRSLWEFGQLGLKVKCFEAGSDVGGAWYWNRYPGARTDSEAWVYGMNFTAGMGDAFIYNERYPSQQEVQRYLGSIVDRFGLRKNIEFNTRIKAAHYSESENIWTITTEAGLSTTSRYFVAASGPLSIAKPPPFAGLKSYTGEWYQTSTWPSHPVDFKNKRVAIIGTGATGVQIIPKLAHVAKELTVFQRTANYVLPGRNYTIDENEAAEIKRDYDETWKHASSQPSGLAMKPSGRSLKTVDPAEVKRVLDWGWETGGFHYHFETFDDIATDQAANDVASDYLRNKIAAIVHDPATAELLTPRYPYLSKRPPCGHFFYEAFNRPNVKLVDISQDSIDLYEKGIITSSGTEREFDIIIFALGFDAATGALDEIDVRGRQEKSLKASWDKKLETYAGVLVPGFPNMFLVCGPHVPFGNMPVVLDIGVKWIGRTVRYLEDKKIKSVEASEAASEAWSQHLEQAFGATLYKESAKTTGAWFVGANIPGKAVGVLFYFGGVPTWTAWLDKEAESGWSSMLFPAVQGTKEVEEYSPILSQGQATNDIKSAA